MVMMQIWDTFLNIMVFVITFTIIRLFLWYDFILNVALVVLSLYLADFFIKMIRDSLPNKPLLPGTDKAVLVTGCDTGFGHLFARELDKKGVTVFAGCLFSEGPGAMELKKSCSKNMHVLQLDVTKDDEIKSAVQNVVSNLGGKKLWAVVNNAGRLLISEAEYATIESTRKVLDVNTLGPARVTQAFLPLLRRYKGRVVIVTSVAGRITFPVVSSYCMSKQATMAYALGLRRELLRWGVSVHTVEPWAFKTQMGIKENFTRIFMNEWNQAPDSVRADYGGDIYVRKILEHYKPTPQSDLHLVTDCLMDAAIGRYPKLHYFPGFPGRILIYLNDKLPSGITDFILQSALPKIDRSQNRDVENHIVAQ